MMCICSGDDVWLGPLIALLLSVTSLRSSLLAIFGSGHQSRLLLQVIFCFARVVAWPCDCHGKNVERYRHGCLPSSGGSGLSTGLGGLNNGIIRHRPHGLIFILPATEIFYGVKSRQPAYQDDVRS